MEPTAWIPRLTSMIERTRRLRANLFAGCLFGFAVAIAAGCAPPWSPASQSPSGPTGVVVGVVLAGPTCPVERPGQSACVRAVSGATILALDAAGHEAGRADSDAAGAYSIALSAGTYRLEAQLVAGLLGTPTPVTVEIRAGQTVRQDFEYDTGIR